jgi:hypothetical protein
MNDEQFKYMEPGEDFEEEIGKLEMSYIWQRQSEVRGSRICRTVKDRCYDIEKQNLLVGVSLKNSVLY